MVVAKVSDFDARNLCHQARLGRVDGSRGLQADSHDIRVRRVVGELGCGLRADILPRGRRHKNGGLEQIGLSIRQPDHPQVEKVVVGSLGGADLDLVAHMDACPQRNIPVDDDLAEITAAKSAP